MRRDLGRFGKYMTTYRNLRRYEKEGTRFLFNLYIPKGENGTTEIDMLMLSTKGLFVFESKNYSAGSSEASGSPSGTRPCPMAGGGAARKPSTTPSCRITPISAIFRSCWVLTCPSIPFRKNRSPLRRTPDPADR